MMTPTMINDDDVVSNDRNISRKNEKGKRSNRERDE